MGLACFRSALTRGGYWEASSCWGARLCGGSPKRSGESSRHPGRTAVSTRSACFGRFSRFTSDQAARTVCRDETPGRFDGLSRGHQQGIAHGAARLFAEGRECDPEPGMVIPCTSCVRSFQLSSLQRLSRWKSSSACDLDRAHLRSIGAVRKLDRDNHPATGDFRQLEYWRE